MRRNLNLVLGIDPGTQLGWAVCTHDGRIVMSGVESFTDVANKGYGAMFVAFRALLRNLQRNHGPFAAIAYELPFMRGPVPSRILWGMAAHTQERCAMWRCRPLPVNTMTLKKFATGSGKADKAQMISAAWLVLGEQHAPQLSEHEADAIHVARWGVAQLNDRGGQGRWRDRQ